MDAISPSSPVDPDLAGKELGDYRLMCLLGRGGMSHVYLAQQQSLQRPVAVKILRAELARDPTALRRFYHEARAIAALVHANIVQVYEVNCVDGWHFIAQEYVSGQTLRQYLDKHGPLAPRFALSIMFQVGAALQCAAERQIVHRDIKPENILLTSTGDVKVADFGLAHVYHQSIDENFTQVGMTVGTPLYMSPEQIEGRTLDSRSDLYSLGVTSFQMLCGRPPFQGPNPLTIAVQHVRSAPPAMDMLRPDLPVRFCQIVTRMLAKHPDGRYPSVASFLADLQSCEFPSSADDGKPKDAGLVRSMLVRPIGESNLASVRQLQALIDAQRDGAAPGGRWWRLAVLLVVCFAIGGGLAWLTRPPWPLDPSQATQLTTVPKLASAEKQYRYAVMEESPAAWQAVWQYFPPSDSAQHRLFGYRAKQGLAWTYMEREWWQEALVLLEELASLGDGDPEFRSYGLAGQAIVYDELGNDPKMRELMAKALDLVQYLEPPLRPRFQVLVRRTTGQPIPRHEPR